VELGFPIPHISYVASTDMFIASQHRHVELKRINTFNQQSDHIISGTQTR